jgi:glutathione S-transferase
MTPPVLWHFRFSHYNEKARWALDWKRVPHVRRALAAGPHARQMLELSGQQSVPVLELHGRVVPDSTAIIAALEEAVPAPALYPSDPGERARALDLEDHFDEVLGPHVRRLAWDALLPDRAFVTALFMGGLEPELQAFYDDAFPMLEQLMRHGMQIDDAGVADSRAKVAAALDHLERVRGGRVHLVGDHFTVADLTAAALLAPLLVPPQLQYPFPEPRPEVFETMRSAYTSHPGCVWALEVYRRHRGTSAATAG